MPPNDYHNKMSGLLNSQRSAFTGASRGLQRVFEVPLDKLRPNPHQPRTEFNENALRELADSINKHGLLQAIIVSTDPESERDNFIIVAGERRFRAHQLLGRETIQAVLTSGDPAEIAVIENLQREDLQPLEEALAIKNLMELHNYTQEQVSEIVGKARSTITNLLRITTLPQRILDECSTSNTAKVSKSALIEIARLGNEDEQLAYWDAVKNGLTPTVKQTRAKKKNESSSNADRTPSQKVLGAGHYFVNELTKISNEGIPSEPELLNKLNTLREKINTLLEGLNETHSSANIVDE